MMQASAYSLAETVEAVVQEHAGAIGALLPVLHSLPGWFGARGGSDRPHHRQ
jgi:hypothetical protein